MTQLCNVSLLTHSAKKKARKSQVTLYIFHSKNSAYTKSTLHDITRVKRRRRVRVLIPHFGLIPRVIILELFLDMVPRPSVTNVTERFV